MKDHIIHISLLFLSIFLISLPQSHSQEDHNKYQVCSKPFTCGTLHNIPYPFWAEAERPQYCGGRDQFKLTCDQPNQPPSIHIVDPQEQDFQVLNINDTTYTMKMKMIRVLGLAAYERCYPPLANNTLSQSTLFHYTQNVYNITVFYDCPPNYIFADNFTCYSGRYYGEGDKQYAFYVEDALLPQHRELWSCGNRSQLQVLRSAPLEHGAGIDGLKKAVESGFEVKYDIEDVECKNCRQSEGVCGRNDTSDEYRFSCHCPDGSEASLSCPSMPS